MFRDDMSFKDTILSSTVRTERTSIWFFTSVNEVMMSEIRFVVESPATYRASIGACTTKSKFIERHHRTGVVRLFRVRILIFINIRVSCWRYAVIGWGNVTGEVSKLSKIRECESRAGPGVVPRGVVYSCSWSIAAVITLLLRRHL